MKLKVGPDFDEEELENAEYEDRQDFEEYDGPEPKAKTVLPGRIEAMWATTSRNGDLMFKVLFVAETDGHPDANLRKYDGWQGWDNIVFIQAAAFRYKPFLEALGVTLRDIRRNTEVEDEEQGRMGNKIKSIRNFVPGDGAKVMVKTKTETYEGERSAKIATYMALDPDDGDYSDSEPEEDSRPRRRPAATSSSSTPARRSSASATRSASRSRLRDEDDEQPDDRPF